MSHLPGSQQLTAPCSTGAPCDRHTRALLNQATLKGTEGKTTIIIFTGFGQLPRRGCEFVSVGTKDILPLPAQFLIESSALASMTGTPVRYRLISLWPINPDALFILPNHSNSATVLRRGRV